MEVDKAEESVSGVKMRRSMANEFNPFEIIGLSKEMAKSYRGPNYRALCAFVRERDSRYEGPEDLRSLYSGARVLKKARSKFAEEASENLSALISKEKRCNLFKKARESQPRGIAEKFCYHALKRLSKPPLLPKSCFDHATGCAKAALACYNEENPGAEFELVEPIQGNGFMNREGIWSHVNFTAKPKNNADPRSDDASPKLFFAELNFEEDKLYLAGNKYLVCRCSIVDPDSSETIPDCAYCYFSGQKKIYHVRGSFQFGRRKDKSLARIWP